MYFNTNNFKSKLKKRIATPLDKTPLDKYLAQRRIFLQTLYPNLNYIPISSLQSSNVDQLISYEIQQALLNSFTNPNTLFGTNSEATKAIVKMFKEQGKEWITTLTRQTLEIIRNSQDLEVDPARPDDPFDEHQASLSTTAADVLTFIIEALDRLPIEIKSLCRSFKEKLTVAFNANPGFQKHVIIKYHSLNQFLSTQLAGILFLRFITPGIQAPDFYSNDLIITESERRKSILIVKVIQSVCNRATAPKETFLAPVIRSLHPFTRLFEHRLLQIGAESTEQTAARSLEKPALESTPPPSLSVPSPSDFRAASLSIPVPKTSYNSKIRDQLAASSYINSSDTVLINLGLILIARHIPKSHVKTLDLEFIADEISRCLNNFFTICDLVNNFVRSHHTFLNFAENVTKGTDNEALFTGFSTCRQNLRESFSKSELEEKFKDSTFAFTQFMDVSAQASLFYMKLMGFYAALLPVVMTRVDDFRRFLQKSTQLLSKQAAFADKLRSVVPKTETMAISETVDQLRTHLAEEYKEYYRLVSDEFKNSSQSMQTLRKLREKKQTLVSLLINPTHLQAVIIPMKTRLTTLDKKLSKTVQDNVFKKTAQDLLLECRAVLSKLEELENVCSQPFNVEDALDKFIALIEREKEFHEKFIKFYIDYLLSRLVKMNKIKTYYHEKKLDLMEEKKVKELKSLLDPLQTRYCQLETKLARFKKIQPALQDCLDTCDDMTALEDDLDQTYDDSDQRSLLNDLLLLYKNLAYKNTFYHELLLKLGFALLGFGSKEDQYTAKEVGLDTVLSSICVYIFGGSVHDWETKICKSLKKITAEMNKPGSSFDTHFFETELNIISTALYYYANPPITIIQDWAQDCPSVHPIKFEPGLNDFFNSTMDFLIKRAKTYGINAIAPYVTTINLFIQAYETLVTTYEKKPGYISNLTPSKLRS
ncbi:RasGAP domain-containing protein, partial [Thermoproteota archaeon]